MHTKVVFNRSLINESISQALAVFKEFHLALPSFAKWSVDEWLHKGTEYDEIRDCMLGWDVTDFGSGCFPQIGRTLFTLRNGKAGTGGRPYAEKLILDPEGQRSPLHFHRSKMEDIINRAGGNILIQLHAATPNSTPDDRPLQVQVDGETRRIPAGEVIRLRTGQSLTIPPRTFHQFWGEPGSGWTVSGEISTVCDDLRDNFFVEPMTRFPQIDEDVPRTHYLCHEYPPASQ